MTAAETDLPEPQTIADVKVGDTVMVFEFGRWHRTYSMDTVERLTATQIILPGDRRFYRADKGWRQRAGYCVGKMDLRIIVGADAIERRRQIEDEKARTQHSNEWYADTGRRVFDRDTVLKVRAACDRAEAALRQLGEWRDEP